jgi:hypothetical protein
MTSRLAHYRHVLGFDTTEHIPFSTRYRIQCSRCVPAVIMGTPTHERTCPNESKECNGCGNRVKASLRYCEDCR